MKINLETINQCGVRIYDANGVEIERVIEADTTTGKVLQYLPPYTWSTGDGTSTKIVTTKVYAYYPFPLRVNDVDTTASLDTHSVPPAR